MLPRCLTRSPAAVDEIVIVDTGSTDATIEIARSFGARVIEREWTGSFAEARNVSFDAATGDWLIYLDADEVLVARGRSRSCARSPGAPGARRSTCRRPTTPATSRTAPRSRTTRCACSATAREYRFEGRLHEQIAHRLPAYLPERIEPTGIRVEHYGYLGAVRDAPEKSRRNIELLRLQQAESPRRRRSCTSTSARSTRPPATRAAALAEFERSWELLEARPDRGSYEFTPSLHLAAWSRRCASAGARRTRSRARERGSSASPGFTDLVLEQATRRRRARASASARSRSTSAASRWATRRARTPRRVGCGTLSAADRAGRAAARRRRARARRSSCSSCACASIPASSARCCPYATRCWRRHGARRGASPSVERALPTRRRRCASCSAPRCTRRGRAPPARRSSGRARAPAAFARRRASRSARRCSASGATRRPRSRRPRCRDDPLAALACRTELFARIAGGDVSGAVQRTRAGARGRYAGR